MNSQGNKTAYRLIPVRTGTPRHDLDYTMADFWVTRCCPAGKGVIPEEIAAPSLPTFVSDGQPTAGQDVILWYTGGIHHIPRDEDDLGPTQLMVEGFMLMPENLFDSSPLFTD